MHNNNSPPGGLLQQANAVQSQGPDKFSQGLRQKTGAAGANADLGIPLNGHPIFLCSWKEIPK